MKSKIFAVVFSVISCAAVLAGTPAGVTVLTMPDGSKVEAELALTPEVQERGLMYRKSLPFDRGMLFVFREGGVKTFWMKNTYIPLDIVFLNAGMKVRNIYHRVPRSDRGQPESQVAKVSAPASYVLELASGKARKCGLKPGFVIKSSVPLEPGAHPAVKRSTAAHSAHPVVHSTAAHSAIPAVRPTAAASEK
ncbi:MAG: hypothetical protein COT18_10235 [Elusimicrobia bacterium CG08_land_8_20_14_0_20_59_10]|nr:MAG: hypothetical protein COT18_10235 [Elusimicrobia bacterium CG08_land_8_20_14_0_20_59_10]